jgi:hypothetical protein
MPLRVAEGNQPHLIVVDDEADRGAFIADVAQLVWWDTATITDISLNLSPEDVIRACKEPWSRDVSSLRMLPTRTYRDFLL